jgi:hypothetical protein
VRTSPHGAFLPLKKRTGHYAEIPCMWVHAPPGSRMLSCDESGSGSYSIHPPPPADVPKFSLHLLRLLEDENSTF